MSLPRTLGELQLYCLLQRANLSVYYQNFVQQGGDDVRQLCEAGEEEFLEIMALVGMATKPLHVRRMQKALREWAANPAAFSSLPRFKLAGASAQEPKRKAVSGSGDAFPGSKRLRTLITAGAGSTSPNSGKDLAVLSPGAEEGRANQDGGRALPNSGAEEDAERSALNEKLANPVGMELSDPAEGEEAGGGGRSDSKRGGSKQPAHHQLAINEVATRFCKEDSSLLLRRANLFSPARLVAREFAYRKTRLSSEEIDDTPVKNIKHENQLGAASERTSVGQSQEEFVKHQDVDSLGYRHTTKEDNGPLSRDVFAGQPQSAECHWGSPSGSLADAAKIASAQGTGNRHILGQTQRDRGLRLAELVSDDQRSGQRPHRREIAQNGAESPESRSASKNTENGPRAAKNGRRVK
ncbi:NGFI-A-binding protein 2-like [Pristis pectinata]|uniref:NGFI-A-binding protein 2-like n=1 Tax=Pristis pectinata TaxID=685728 RepID=UPI00223D7A89|nr:NGFI-A-binding protein 2-like [Pristis pectinata]